jgi:hypothetical protein
MEILPMSEFLPAIHAGDSLVVQVDVADGSGALNLTGATVTAALRSQTGAEIAVQAAVTDASAGRIVLSVPAAAITAGVWRMQARVALPNGEAQTVTDARLTAQDSIL